MILNRGNVSVRKQCRYKTGNFSISKIRKSVWKLDRIGSDRRYSAVWYSKSKVSSTLLIF
ncbi:hypothetical protein LEP1GSC176_1628 [Leptospira kirschneri str. MMD1493]|nr:hypothetical protein LEP1GSC176_1628 [Leptospira kirschneri str. MMD1493]